MPEPATISISNIATSVKRPRRGNRGAGNTPGPASDAHRGDEVSLNQATRGAAGAAQETRQNVYAQQPIISLRW
jgi:hypothetical protein